MAENKGSWLDTKANKVVASQPEEGIQLIAPGTEPTPNDLAAVEAVKASLAPDAEPAPTAAKSASGTTK